MGNSVKWGGKQYAKEQTIEKTEPNTSEKNVKIQNTEYTRATHATHAGATNARAFPQHLC